MYYTDDRIIVISRYKYFYKNINYLSRK